MMGQTHMTTGVTAGAWLAAAGSVAGVPPVLVVLGVPLAAYAAILPDLDHPRSTATYSLGPLTIVISWILRQFVDHRGPTHTRTGAAVTAAAVAGPTTLLPAPLGGWSALWWFLVVLLGCLTHVWGDARTLSGVPWTGGPRSIRLLGREVASVDRRGRLRIGRVFRTGSDYEDWRLHRMYLPAAVVAVSVGAVALRVFSR
jgi:membrane-bound metal-dependent hydrolase YbcI (DUF457 family)